MRLRFRLGKSANGNHTRLRIEFLLMPKNIEFSGLPADKRQFLDGEFATCVQVWQLANPVNIMGPLPTTDAHCLTTVPLIANYAAEPGVALNIPDVHIRRLVWEIEKTFGVGSASKDTNESLKYLKAGKTAKPRITFPVFRTCKPQPSDESATAGDASGKTRRWRARGKVAGTRYTDVVHLSDAVKHNLAKNLPPEATEDDLLALHNAMQSSLASNTKSSIKSILRKFEKLIPERDVILNPHPGDRDLLFARLLQDPGCKPATAIQYMKSYNTILQTHGSKPPPVSDSFLRAKKGQLNCSRRPLADAAASVTARKAYSIESLRLLSIAIGKMKGEWCEYLQQAVLTIGLIAFWGRFRINELLQSTVHTTKLEDALLLSDVVTLKEGKKGSRYLRVWLRKEKAAAEQCGSLVEIPLLPKELKDVCPVRAYANYIRLRKNLANPSNPDGGNEEDQFELAFIRPDGRPLTIANFRKFVKTAIAKLPNLTKDQFTNLTNHSFRSGVPTLTQALEQFIPKEILNSLGRWSSDSSLRYLKSVENGLKPRRWMEQELLSSVSEAKNRHLI